MNLLYSENLKHHERIQCHVFFSVQKHTVTGNGSGSCYSGSLRGIQNNIWQRHKVWPVHSRSKDREYPHVPPSYCSKLSFGVLCNSCSHSNFSCRI